MEVLQQALQRLSDLCKAGVISQDEFEDRRKQLLDEFVGIPQLRILSRLVTDTPTTTTNNNNSKAILPGGGDSTVPTDSSTTTGPCSFSSSSSSYIISSSQHDGGGAHVGEGDRGTGGGSRQLHSVGYNTVIGGLAGLMLGGTAPSSSCWTPSSSSSWLSSSSFASSLSSSTTGPGPGLGTCCGAQLGGSIFGTFDIKGAHGNSNNSSSRNSRGFGRGGGYGLFPETSGGGGGGGTFRGDFSVKVQPLPRETTRQHLIDIFSLFGEVRSAVVNTGNPCYGYVDFLTEAGANAAKAAGTISIFGLRATVKAGLWRKPADMNVESPPTQGLGLFNIPYSTSRAELQSMLKDHPGFQLLKMIYRKDGKFKGYAFAYFDSVENAIGCKTRLSGLTIRGQTIDIKFASKLEFPPPPPLQSEESSTPF